jgi:hypothetical protein
VVVVQIIEVQIIEAQIIEAPKTSKARGGVLFSEQPPPKS